MKSTPGMGVALLVCALVGCDSGGDSGDGMIAGLFSGSVSVDTGFSAPVNGDLVVAWGVFTGSPDYVFLSTGGEVDAVGFSIMLPDVLQDEAINSFGVSVGEFAAFSMGSAPDAGVLENGAPISSPVGGSDHALIYKTANADDTVIDWTGAFPVGYSCGLVLRGTATFDSFVPVSCDEVTVRIGAEDTFGFNWF